MDKREKSLYRIDRQGQLIFSLRSDLVREYTQSDSKWEHPVAAVVVMCVCGVLDFVMFQQLFSSFLYDSKVIQMLSILAMLIGFDFAPIFLGIALKKRKQGLNVGSIVVVLMILAFVIAFIANVALRIEVKDLVLPDLSSSTTATFGDIDQTQTTNKISLLYALFASAMPLITSLVSFGVSYMTSNPLRMRMQKLKEDQIAIEDNISEIEALLVEYKSDPDHFERLLKDDDEKYENIKGILRERTVHYCDYVREMLKEHLGDPASNNLLSKNRRQELLHLLDREGDVDTEDLDYSGIISNVS